MAKLRTKGKSTIVWILMGLLILSLGGFGVTNFGGSSADIASVGKTSVSAEDYGRSLQSQMRSISQQTGQAISIIQAEAMGVPQQVQAQLITGAALSEEARKIGLSVSDTTVAEAIVGAPDFRGPNGQFNRAAYDDFLRRQRLDEGSFNEDVRDDQVRFILREAVIDGTVAPQPAVDQSVLWLLETRDIEWREVTAEELPQPVTLPDQATLEAWHQANADRFTAPELRRITYAWVTPEMLAGEVDLDEAALRASYDARIEEFQQPERRMVERLVFPSQEEAQAARDQLDAGAASFEDLARARGLSLEDVYMGEVSQDQLGVAGAAVFGLDQPGIAGPVDTELGPALFSMNAILEPVDIPFEQAQQDLRAEAAADRARRIIQDRADDYEDLLASGATLEDLAEETDLQLGQIDFSASSEPAHGGIDGYQAFREQASLVAENDFPQLYQLDDGGVFALRLDEVVPPALRPFDEVADQVAADWTAAETHRLLLDLAEEQSVAAAAMPSPADAATAGVTEALTAPDEATPAAETDEPQMQRVDGLSRDGWIDGVPPQLIVEAFGLAETGMTDVVDADDRVFLIRLDAVHHADLVSDTAADAYEAVDQRMTQSLQADLFDYYVRALQQINGLTLNTSVINSVHTQVQ